MDEKKDIPVKPVKSKKKITVLDVVVIILVVLCIVSVFVRSNLGGNGEMAIGARGDIEEYSLTFTINDIRKSTAENYINDGDVFYTSDGDKFGVLDGAVSINPAQYYTVDSTGTCIKVSAADNGDQSRRTVKGTLAVSGSMSEQGFMLNGTTYVAPNQEIEVHGDDVSFTIKVVLISTKG